ncbi:hypothetical protein PAEPH01_1746 [Pancytospora epiphaga]|nr:hypothetical protein PAEPH01_1746 [Pancytospora epiphaga]
MSYTQGGPNKPIEKVDLLNAQLTISKAQLKSLEKDNYELRQQVSSLYRAKNEAEAEYERKLNAYKKEYAIRDAASLMTQNKSPAVKNGVLTATDGSSRISNTCIENESLLPIDNSEINLRYAFKQTVNIDALDSREEIEKLRFFRNYFFDDFYSISTEAVVDAIEKCQLKNDMFMEVFQLFCCKKPVFDEYITRALEMQGYISTQVSILENVPVDWICDCIVANTGKIDCGADPGQNTHGNYRNACVKNFVINNTTLLLNLLGSIVALQPEALSIVFSKKKFNETLDRKEAAARRLVSLICRGGGHGFIDERNFEKIPLKDLYECYGEECLFA